MAATKTAALDHLIDVLAGENIETRGTVATVIDTLASLIEDGTIVIGGGGGGGEGDVTALSFAETLDLEGNYTLSNATAVLDALEAIAGADDIAKALASYNLAWQADDGAFRTGVPSYSGGEPDEVHLGDFADGNRAYIGASVSGGVIAFRLDDLAGTEVTRADIDPDTDILSATMVVE